MRAQGKVKNPVDFPFFLSAHWRRMIVYLNNDPVDTDSSTLDAFLAKAEMLDRQGIAVAVNQEVIPRNEWTEYRLQEHDEVLVITATQGG